MTGAGTATVGLAGPPVEAGTPTFDPARLAGAAALATLVWPLTSLPWLSVVLIAGAVAVLLRTPALPMALCLGFYGLTLGYNQGLQPEEVLFVLYYPAYVGLWVGLRAFVYREPVIRDLPDAAMALFCVGLPLALGLGQLYGGDLGTGLNEALNFSLLSLYFPAKELARRYDWGGAAIVGFLLVLALGAIVQNAFLVREALADAEAAWQIARGRVPMSEMLITVGAILAATYAALAPGRREVLLGLLAFAVFAGGLAITQSRAYYVDLVAGLGLLFLLLQGRARWTFAGTMFGAAVLIGVVGWLVLGEWAELIALGILDRLLSIGTATQSDISYLNRLLENDAVWDRIAESPVIGQGLGVSFSFFDAIFAGTWTKPFVHNGYLMLWFKFGIVGLGAVLAAWLGSAAQALGAARRLGAETGVRAAVIAGVGVTLIALLPSHMVSATFATSETVLCVGLLMGVAGGTAARTRAA